MIRSLSLFSFLFLVSSLLFLSSDPVQAQTPSATSGSIIETMDASGYTYLLLDIGTEKQWVAIPATEVTVGEKVTFLDGMLMKDFFSKTLNKTFTNIIFSPGLEGMKKSPHSVSAGQETTKSSFADAVKAESGKSAPPSTPAPSSGGSTGAMVPFVDMQVEKAPGENSYSVEEIFNQAGDLDGKRVQVKGKVVKFSPNIMGKNWIHIQDGSGDPMKNTHDLVVTSADQTDIDVIVVVEGKVSANKDFGFGYKYDAMLEEGKISK